MLFEEKLTKICLSFSFQIIVKFSIYLLIKDMVVHKSAQAIKDKFEDSFLFLAKKEERGVQPNG